MVTTLQDHVSLLQNFASNPATISPENAAEAILHITRAAAQSLAPKPAVTLAQTTLTALSKTPSVLTVPHLLSICEHDPFEALDVFVLSSAAWKALVATVITSPPEPHLAIRVIFCATLNATRMIAKCLQPSTHTTSEVLRTVKIAKFYCLNAARCSKAFFNSIPHFQSTPLSSLFTNLFDCVSLTTFVLLFDRHALLPAHDELCSEVLPLVTKTLKIILAMMLNTTHHAHENVVRGALESTGNHPTMQSLRLPHPVLHLLAILHTTRCLLDSNQELYKTKESERASHALVISFLIPNLFNCFDRAYEELILFREQSGTAFLDTVISATLDIISAAVPCYENASQRSGALDFLLEQATSENAIQSYVAQEALLHLAKEQGKRDIWRDPIVMSVFACFRTSLSLNSRQTFRWQQLAVNLCQPFVQEGITLRNLLIKSKRIFHCFENHEQDLSSQLLDDPIAIPLIAHLCDSLASSEHDNPQEDINSQSHTKERLIQRVARIFDVSTKTLTEHAKDLALTSTSHTAQSAVWLLPHLLDTTSVCGTAISILQRESGPSHMICAALDILHPYTMKPNTMDAACTAASAALMKYGIAVCPAIASFVSKAAQCLGETVSLSHWQKLSALLETCLTTSSKGRDADSPKSQMVHGALLHHAALSLNAIRCSNRSGRQTAATLPGNILNDAQDALNRLDAWNAGERECDLGKERNYVVRERKVGETPKDLHAADKSKAVHSMRTARELMLEAANLLLDGDNKVCVNEDVRGELVLLEHCIKSLERCNQRNIR